MMSVPEKKLKKRGSTRSVPPLSSLVKEGRRRHVAPVTLSYCFRPAQFAWTLLIVVLVIFTSTTGRMSADEENQKSSLAKRFGQGRSASEIYGRASDGNICELKTNRGSIVVLSYLDLSDRSYDHSLTLLSEIFKKYEGQENLRLVTIWTNDFDIFMAEMNRRGFEFYNSRQWWKLSFAGPWTADDPSIMDQIHVNRRDLTKKILPFHMVLDRELNVIEAAVPETRLSATVYKAIRDSKTHVTPAEEKD